MKKKSLIIMILSIIGLDQLSKYLLISSYKPFESSVIIKNFFKITYVQNKGAAWGIFNNSTILLALLALVAIYIIIRSIKKNKTSNTELCLYGLLIGGIIGNLIDRLFRGYVVDFFDFYIFGYDFPVFNIADIFIVVSVFLLLILSFKKEGK